MATIAAPRRKPVARAPETGAFCVAIWFVTGYNTDHDDLKAGGSHVLGPSYWVCEEYETRFIARMKQLYQGRFQSIEQRGDRDWKPFHVKPTLEEQVEDCREYIASLGE